MSDQPPDAPPDAPVDSILVSGVTLEPGVATINDQRYPSIRFKFFGQDHDAQRWAVPPISLILDEAALRTLGRHFAAAVAQALDAAHQSSGGSRPAPTGRTNGPTRRKHR